jgi:hypothetical protein
METKIMVLGPGIKWEIIGESLFDCIEVAYRQFRGKRVELIALKPIGYIDGQELFIDDQYLDRRSLKEIIQTSK